MNTKTNNRTANDANDAIQSGADAAKEATQTGSNAAKEATQRGVDAAKEATQTGANAAREATQRSVDAAKDATQSGVNAANEVTRSGAEAAREATAKFTNLATEGQRNLTENFEKLSKGFEGMASFGQDNVEAVVKSSEIAAKAFEGIGSEISAYSKRSFEDGIAAAQDFASSRSVTELFEKQTSYAQTAFEGWLQQTNKMNEILAAAAKDISAPIGQRLSAASDAMKGFSQ